MRKLINLDINEDQLKKNAQIARERGIVLPTLDQMKNPNKIPEKTKQKLKNIGLWDTDTTNLFRITWKNEPKKEGGLFQDLPNYIEIPTEISGVKARIIALEIGRASCRERV